VASAGEVVVFIKGSVGTGNLVSIPLEGGTVRLLVRDVYADSLATDGASVYWTDESREAVMKLDLASGAPVALARYNGIGSIVGETALALDATSVYWTSPSACSGTCGGAVMKLTPR
jgi:sugar lactone lactonase YvrE